MDSEGWRGWAGHDPRQLPSITPKRPDRRRRGRRHGAGRDGGLDAGDVADVIVVVSVCGATLLWVVSDGWRLWSPLAALILGVGLLPLALASGARFGVDAGVSTVTVACMVVLSAVLKPNPRVATLALLCVNIVGLFLVVVSRH